jgi:SAM-dependent methyltransferase
MALLPRGFTKGLMWGGLIALAWGIFGNRRRRATVAGPLVERAEGLPFVGPRLYSFFAGQMMGGVYGAVADDVVSQAASGQLLEIGAGPGYLAAELGSRNRNLVITAMNTTGGMVQAAEARIYEAGLGRQVKVARGDAEDIPFANQAFDYVVSLGGPQHWSAPELALAEIHRVLRPGGVGLIYSLRRELPEEGWDRVREGLEPMLKPVFDMVVAGPAGRALTEGEIASLARRTAFGEPELGVLEAELGGTQAPMLTRVTLRKAAAKPQEPGAPGAS